MLLKKKQYTFILDVKNGKRFKIDTANIIIGGRSFGCGDAKTILEEIQECLNQDQ